MVYAILWYGKQQCICSFLGTAKPQAFRILTYFYVSHRAEDHRRKWVGRKRKEDRISTSGEACG